MNKFLLVAAGLSMAVSAMGQTAVSALGQINQRQATADGTKIVKRAEMPVADVVTDRGSVMKRIAMPLKAQKSINPQAVKKAPAARVEEGLESSDILSESFEGWDGTTATWVPDGWTVESFGSEENEYYHKWHPDQQGLYSPAPTDGKYYYGVIFSSNHQDEWLISPTVTMTEGMNLFFDAYIDPLFFFNLDNLDFDTYEFVGERTIAFNIKVNIREQGGEWVTLLNMADEFMDMSVMDMLYYNLYGELMTSSVDLSAYVGKTFQIAFQYVGIDGQSTYIDNIRIGYPQLETPVYIMPYYTQYWGFTRDFSGLNIGVAALPVFTDNTWMSYDYISGATYTWEYNDPADADNWLTADGDMLTAAYGTDYTSEFTTRNNLYYLPRLTVSAPNSSPATYQNPAAYMQMGGKPDFVANSNGQPVELNMGLVPFNRAAEEIGTYTYREEFGAPALPIFGYADGVDKFWTDYTFHGEDEEGDGVKLTSILNFLYSSESPLVVTAADLFALTQNIGENVEFTCGIYPINDDFTPDMDNPLTVATLAGKDVTILEQGDQSPDVACLTFDFGKAVVLDNSHVAYVVMVSGFNNADVQYFAPIQSLYPADIPMAMGWVKKEITAQGQTRTSFSPMSDENGEPLYTAFAINLEGYLPWLHTEATELEISNNGTVTGFDSYYAAEDLTVTAPEWAEVTVSGRYGSTELTVKAEFSETARSGEITLTAPGVSKTFALTQAAGTGSSGITDIIAEGNDAVEAVFNLAGQQVSADNLPAGIYLVKRASGKVSKVAVK